jgi:MFS family permease
VVLLRFDVDSRTHLISNSPFNSNERRTVSTLALLYSARMVGLFMVLPILVVYGQALEGATPPMLGLALGVYGLTQAILQIPMGWVSDRVGRKPVIIFGLIIFALGSALAAQASSATELVVGRALQGGGAIAGVIMALLADATRPDQRTKAMAVVGISIGLSFGVALVLGPVIASAFGLQGVFNLTAAFALIYCPHHQRLRRTISSIKKFIGTEMPICGA